MKTAVVSNLNTHSECIYQINPTNIGSSTSQWGYDYVSLYTLTQKTPHQVIMECISERLTYFQNLGKNWAGPGSEAPDEIIKQNVLAVIKKLPLKFLQNIDLEDAITPTPRGAIEINWCVNGCEDAHLSLEIGIFSANFYVDIKNQPLRGYDNLLLKDDELLPILTKELYILFEYHEQRKSYS